MWTVDTPVSTLLEAGQKEVIGQQKMKFSACSSLCMTLAALSTCILPYVVSVSVGVGLCRAGLRWVYVLAAG